MLVGTSVVESHPDNAIEDLRLDHPFKTLTEYCNSQNMAEMSKKVANLTTVTHKYLKPCLVGLVEVLVLFR